MKQTDYQEYIRQTRQYYDVKFGEATEIALNAEEAERWQVIKNILDTHPTDRNGEKISILDFGCGDGRFAKLLNHYGQISGVDISEKAISKARRNVPEGEFHVADLSSDKIVEQLGGQFDVIVSTEVIEHVFDQQHFLENIRHLLSNRGIFILTTPNGKCYRHYFGSAERKFGQAYEWWLNPQTLQQMMIESGLKVKIRSSFNNDWIFKRRTKSWLWIIGNRYFYIFLKATGLLRLFKRAFKGLEMGLYSLFVAMPDHDRS